MMFMDTKARRLHNKNKYKEFIRKSSDRPDPGYYGDRALTINSEVQYYESGNVIYKYSINQMEFNEFKDLMFYIIDRAAKAVYSSKNRKDEDDGN